MRGRVLWLSAVLTSFYLLSLSLSPYTLAALSTLMYSLNVSIPDKHFSVSVVSIFNNNEPHSYHSEDVPHVFGSFLLPPHM